MLLLLHANGISVYRCSSGFYQRVLPCIETLIEQAVRLKKIRTATFESSVSLFLLSLNGRVDAIPT